MAKQAGFWSVEERLRELSEQGDPLEKLVAIVDFELFRPVLGSRHRTEAGITLSGTERERQAASARA